MTFLNKILIYVKSHYIILLGHLLATLAFTLYLFYPTVTQSMIQAMVPLASQSGLLFVIGAYGGFSAAIALLLCVAILLFYKLLRSKETILSVAIGFSVSYILISFIRSNFDVSPLMIVVSIILTYTTFMAASYLKNLRLHPALSALIAILIIWTSLFFITPAVTYSGDLRHYTAVDNTTFNNTLSTLNFTVYYPTYHSSILPASPAKLNGYSKSGFTNPTVTFLLGIGQVKESGPIANQDKIMNSSTGACLPYLIFSSMEKPKGVNSQDMPEGPVNNYMRCNTLVTQSGLKVYYSNSSADGQTTYFYTQIKNTNIVISFDNFMQTKKYNDSQQSEVLKVIDSLQPLSKSQLSKGSAEGFGFSQ